LISLPDSVADSFVGLLRSHRKRARTRARIIHAAVELIGTEGISAILVSDVAERANVTSGTVYNHFACRVDHCMKSLSRDVARRIRRGARAGVFRVGSLAAATDLVVGTLIMALRNLVRGKVDAERCGGTAAMLLQALGMSARDAGAAVESAQGRRGS
jgi:hypothetical protein